MTSASFYLMLRILTCRMFGCRIKPYKKARNVMVGREVVCDGCGGLTSHPVYNLAVIEQCYCQRCGAVTGENK